MVLPGIGKLSEALKIDQNKLQFQTNKQGRKSMENISFQVIELES